MKTLHTDLSADRMRIGKQHENKVLDRLRSLDYNVVRYGQGLLPEEIRRDLVRSDSRLRWEPDLIATKTRNRHGHIETVVFGVDAKATTNLHSSTFSVEIDAIYAMELAWKSYQYTPAFVWADFTTNHIRDLINDFYCWDHGKSPGTGSGTPFIWWPRTKTRPLEDVFGDEAIFNGRVPGVWRSKRR